MKKKLILGSALGIIMCSSLITGATMALFTSESNVNIAVTTGKVDVTATATEVTTYSMGVQTQDGTFDNGGTATIEGGELILDKVTPGDKAVVALEITNNSNVAHQQRISLTGSLGAELMDQLIVGVSETDSNFTYYSDYTTAWTKVDAVTEPDTTTMYVSIELPAYVGDDWQDKSCEITISVEAVQGNADVTSTTVANEVYLVNNQEELTNAIAEMQSGETVILYGGVENWATADIEYTEVKEITVRGYKVGTMTINAPNGTINLYNDVDTLNVEAIAGNSLHIYGNIVGATIESGRAVVETGAYVGKVNVVPSESNSVKFEVKATVKNITVNTSNSASSADVVIAEGVEVTDMTVEGSGDVTLDNSGTITDTTVGDSSSLKYVVRTAEMLNDLLSQGDSIMLGANITADAVVPEGVTVTLDLNSYKLTNVSDHTIVNNGVLEIKDSAGGGIVDNITHAKAAIYNAQSAQTVLNGGTFIRSAEKGSSTEDDGSNSYYTIINFGTMEINSGVTVKQDGCYSSLVENGWYDGNENTTKKPATLVINGGSFNGGLNTIKNDDYGDLTINNGLFTNVAQAVVLNWNVAKLNGGVYRAEGATDSIILNGYINDTMDKGQLSVKNIEYSGAPLFARMISSNSPHAGYITVYDAETLKAALAVDTATVILGSDIGIYADPKASNQGGLVPIVSIVKDTTLVLNGYKIYVEYEKDVEYAYTPAIFAIDGANVVIEGNGVIDAEAGNNNSYGINIVNSGSLTINGGTYYGAMTAIQVQEGSLTVNGGFFDLAPTCKSQVPGYANYVVNCIDASFKAGTATIEIYGGTFVNCDYSKDPEGAGTSYVVDGYVVTSSKQDNNETWYTVVPEETAE